CSSDLEEYRASCPVSGRRSETEQRENRCAVRGLQEDMLQGSYAFFKGLKKKPPRSGLARWGGHSLLQVEHTIMWEFLKASPRQNSINFRKY
ncbi:hypothetical protein SDB63_23430, partial [Brucella sp. NBRC 113783]|uniref:hypothetical protein n=1 Tax=Brucella sp. NBRC 113783 TaxID=3075478 RepID=UPI0029C06AC2